MSEGGGKRGAGGGSEPVRDRVILASMPSVADSLQRDTRLKTLALPVGERVRLALTLGDTDLELIASLHRLDRSSAKRLIDRRRQAGRTSSRCMIDAIG